MSTMFPAYTPDARCPKCQHAAVLTTYESGRRMFHCEVRNLFDERECLHRTCERCRYGWHEACADVIRRLLDDLDQRDRQDSGDDAVGAGES